MKVEQVKKYKIPDYPDKQSVIKNNELLAVKPERWLGNRFLGTALSAVILISAAACSPKTGETVRKIDTKEAIRQNTALIFEHGNGRGGFGCVSVSPPAFLSEEEALQIIQEETKRQGIEFKSISKELKGIKLPVTNLNPEYDKDGNAKNTTKTKTGTLKLDAYDSEKKIAFEYVSKDDVIEWKGDKVNSTYETYDMLNAAKILREGFEKKNSEMAVGVFYDPVSYFIKNGFTPEAEKIMKENENNLNETEKQFKEISKRDLREQVKDFISWLKSEGII